jgi:adenylate cyclase
VSWYWYQQYSLLIDFTFPLLASLLVYFVLTFVNYFQEQKQRQQIRNAFGFYLSPVLVEQLARSPEKLVLGGEERKMTILFSDVRGFTTISEHYKSEPQRLTALMNRYLTPMTNAIIAHKGTIDKYIGDAIMAFWNAPIDDARQELNACDAALEMLARLKVLNEDLEREAKVSGEPYLPMNIGIGINTGQCVVGNMGSDFRFDYSVLGDSVNLASRLEAKSKDYHLPLILGANTADVAREHFAVMEIDLIRVKGKAEPEAVYTLVGGEDVSASAEFHALRDVNSAMLSQFRKQDWSCALESIERCRKAAENFGIGQLYDVYIERIDDFRRNPPPKDWDGVFTFETK